MNRTELTEFIRDVYSAEPDFPWMKYPDYAAFRHAGSRKWFALIMNVPKNKLGIREDGSLDIVNFKCSPGMITSLLGEEGFFPAYHMNKANWITVALNGSAAEDDIKMLLDMSYEATAPRPPSKKKSHRKTHE